MRADYRRVSTTGCVGQIAAALCQPPPQKPGRRGITTKIAPVKPYSREEKDFVKAFAGALCHATAAVAAHPDMSVPTGSIADHVRRAYLQFRPEEQPAIQKRAHASLSAPAELRQQYFAEYGEHGAHAWSKAAPGLSAELKQQLKDAVRARLDAQQQEIADLLSVGAQIEFVGSLPAAFKTTLETGNFYGDVQFSGTALEIGSPTSIDLRWQTDVPGAERGVWQLYRAGRKRKRATLLATGIAGDAPTSIFSINLADYLPAKPPTLGAVYFIKVTPGTKPKRNGLLFSPGYAVAPPSNNVIITYTVINSPSVQFDIYNIYRTATFYPDAIHMIEDQSGPGSEEFHVAGFVQEMFPTTINGQQRFIVGAQNKFGVGGGFYAVLDPDGPRWANFFYAPAIYNLPYPDAPNWPRVYTGAISVLEEDDGGSLNDWESELWNIAQQSLSGDIADNVTNYLEEKFKDYLRNNTTELIHDTVHLAQAIATIVASAQAGIAGLVIAAAALVIADIFSGAADDFYGMQVFVFSLPTSAADYIEGLPGEPLDNGYRLADESLAFRGATSWPEATAWDGMVEVIFHWEFTDIEQY